MRCVASKLPGVAVSLLVLTTCALAQAETLKLDELEQRAIKNRASVLAARARVDAAEARVDLAKAPYYPTMAARAELDASPGGRIIKVRNVEEGADPTPYAVSGSRTITERGAFIPHLRYQGTVSVQSRLYDFGKTAATVRAARADRDASNAGVSAERHAVVMEVRSAYLAWLSAYETRQILAENAADSTSLRVSAEAHVAEGARPGAELASARYDEARAALDLERGDSDLASARVDLEQVTGGPLPRSAEPDVSLLERAAPSAGAASHPEVSALERRRDAAAASAESHAYPYAPVLAVGANAGVSGQTTTVFPLYEVALSVTVPVFDGGVESASAAVASAQARDLAAQARELRGRVTADHERSRSQLERSGRRLELAGALVAAAEEAVRHAEDQRTLGSGSLDEVVAAKMRVARAKLEVLNARVERAKASLELTAAER